MVSFFDPQTGGMCEVATAAVYPDSCPDRREGEVAAWRVPPTRIPGDEHGLRVVLPPGADRSGTTVVLRYRYLGWPFTAQRVWR